MHTKSFTGKVEEFMGKKLAEPIPYGGDAAQYDSVPECQASEDWPAASEILKFVNGKSLTAAKAKAYQKATEKLKEEYDKSDDKKRADLIKAMLAVEGTTLAEAEEFAALKLGPRV